VQLLAEEDMPLETLVTRLNRSVGAACPENRFITFFMAALDPASGEFAYVNAGHNPPFLVRASGAVETLTEGGPIMGILKGVSYREARAALEPGDVLTIFSDGVSEARNPADEEFGEERLEKELVKRREQSAGAIVNGVHAALLKFMDDAPAADDMTLLVIRRGDYPTQQVLTERERLA
jgi:sigma-B regulation protein RsbU (phosphoserine phosphatase)